jgi:hypothetical protein
MARSVIKYVELMDDKQNIETSKEFYTREAWQGMQHEWGRGGMHIGYWSESQKERDHWEDQNVDWWTILKWILER